MLGHNEQQASCPQGTYIIHHCEEYILKILLPKSIPSYSTSYEQRHQKILQPKELLRK